jgi:hypothetical protein
VPLQVEHASPEVHSPSELLCENRIDRIDASAEFHVITLQELGMLLAVCVETRPIGLGERADSE